MDDAALVRGGEPARDLHGVLDGLADGKRTRLQPLAQRRAFEQLHHQRAVLEAVDLRDVGMVERRQDFRFALEPGEAVRVAGERLRQDLDRHRASEPRIRRAIDLAHAARAEGARDLVLPDSCA